ncbi:MULTISPECIES: MarR family winged helix-turn-helix transcriptional regulator [Microbacterium]|uniref:MarR family winged helix-turn-helix transcriptional regulator n=1 Tax=Microbacterium TaxID=33882 RepID=UPI00217CDEB7|nr:MULTISPECIES: MarR family transcriptional regulator [Microbacterium]UWF78384.1 MarR family transcriptional regulator [Microbacterium neungamense]WCM56560.1 MarR family transcriptional regulator [Microbacterium sp. EF45047]
MNRADILPRIVIAAHALARIAARDAGNDAPSAQWRVLSLLEASAGARIGALATSARTTQPGMTRLIGEMERAGLVIRTADPEDSRATVVTATEEGRRALRAWRDELRDTLAPRFADLSEADWRALERAAQLLAERSDGSTIDRTGDEG